MIFKHPQLGIIGSHRRGRLSLQPRSIDPERAIGTGWPPRGFGSPPQSGPTLIGFMLARAGSIRCFLMFAGVAVVGLVACDQNESRRATCVLEEIAR